MLTVIKISTVLPRLPVNNSFTIALDGRERFRSAPVIVAGDLQSLSSLPMKIQVEKSCSDRSSVREQFTSGGKPGAQISRTRIADCRIF